MNKCIHIDSGIELNIIRDELLGNGFGTITLVDTETEEEHVMGGEEFEMEYQRI